MWLLCTMCVNCVQNPQMKCVCFILGKNELRWIVWTQRRRGWTNVILITASSTISEIIATQVGRILWYGLKLFILCSKWNHNHFFPMNLIKWKKFISETCLDLSQCF